MAHKYFVNESLGMIVCHSQDEWMWETEERKSEPQNFHCPSLSWSTDLEAWVVSPYYIRDGFGKCNSKWSTGWFMVLFYETELKIQTRVWIGFSMGLLIKWQWTLPFFWLHLLEEGAPAHSRGLSRMEWEIPRSVMGETFFVRNWEKLPNF